MLTARMRGPWYVRIATVILCVIGVFASGEVTNAFFAFLQRLYGEMTLHLLVFAMLPVCLFLAGLRGLALGSIALTLLMGALLVVLVGALLLVNLSAEELMRINFYRGWGNQFEWYLVVAVSIFACAWRQIWRGEVEE